MEISPVEKRFTGRLQAGLRLRKDHGMRLYTLMIIILVSAGLAGCEGEYSDAFLTPGPAAYATPQASRLPTVAPNPYQAQADFAATQLSNEAVLQATQDAREERSWAATQLAAHTQDAANWDSATQAAIYTQAAYTQAAEYTQAAAAQIVRYTQDAATQVARETETQTALSLRDRQLEIDAKQQELDYEDQKRELDLLGRRMMAETWAVTKWALPVVFAVAMIIMVWRFAESRRVRPIHRDVNGDLPLLVDGSRVANPDLVIDGVVDISKPKESRIVSSEDAIRLHENDFKVRLTRALPERGSAARLVQQAFTVIDSEKQLPPHLALDNTVLEEEWEDER